MESIDFRVAIAHKMPPKTRDKVEEKPIPKKVAKPAKTKRAQNNSNHLSPYECYNLARDNGHDPNLERQILKSDDAWTSYLYALNINGANIKAHIQHIAKSPINKDERYVILNELSFLLKSKEPQNG